MNSNVQVRGWMSWLIMMRTPGIIETRVAGMTVVTPRIISDCEFQHSILVHDIA